MCVSETTPTSGASHSNALPDRMTRTLPSAAAPSSHLAEDVAAHAAPSRTKRHLAVAARLSKPSKPSPSTRTTVPPPTGPPPGVTSNNFWWK